jgi:hypothetical protein
LEQVRNDSFSVTYLSLLRLAFGIRLGSAISM